MLPFDARVLKAGRGFRALLENGSGVVSSAINRVRETLLQSTIGQRILNSKGGFAHRVILLAGGSAMGQAVSVLAAPLLTRLYSPEDFGLLTVYASILSGVLGIASLRYHVAVPIARDDESTANLVALCVLIVVGMAGLLGAGLWFFGDALVTWTQAEGLLGYLWLLPLSFLGAGLYQVLSAWAIRNNFFGPLARTRLGQGLGLVITQITLGLFRVGASGLLIGDAVGRAAGSLNLARLAWSEHRDVRGSVTFERMRQIAVRYRRFPLIQGPSSILNNLRGQLPTLLMASMYGGHVVGLFGLGQRLLTVTFFLIAGSVGDVYLNEAARMAREDPSRMMSLYWRTLRRSVVFVVPLLGSMALVAPWIFGPVFGPEWVEAGQYVRILAVLAVFEFLGRAVSSTVSVLERQDLDFVGDILGIVLIAGAFAIAAALETSPMGTLVIYVVAGSLNALINLGLVWYAIWRMNEDGATGSPTDMVGP
jgi:O-antigen/teichoic acid export membrane protein